MFTMRVEDLWQYRRCEFMWGSSETWHRTASYRAMLRVKHVRKGVRTHVRKNDRAHVRIHYKYK